MPEYPRRLQHATPVWVTEGARFHIRIRVAEDQPASLIAPELAPGLLQAAADYHYGERWWCDLFLLMPDHLHAILAFPRVPGMATVVRNWKRGAARCQDVRWQDNFFDHRLRSRKEAQAKWHYIRLNPVVKGLCARIEDWPFWWSGDPEAR